MIELSSPLNPQDMQRGDVFSAFQYSRSLVPDFFDPVLNADWYDTRETAFAAHPHARFSAITYLFAESAGGLINRDSLRHSVDLLRGSMYVSRASRAMIHEETPARTGLPVHGLQIFFNLPAARQMDEAGAFHVAPQQMRRINSARDERVAIDGTTIDGVQDALPAPVTIREVGVAPQGSAETVVPAGWGGLAIMIGGVAVLRDMRLDKADAIAFRNRAQAGHMLVESAWAVGTRKALIAGAQLRQPIYQSGPMMFADLATLDDRVAAFRRGEFGNLPGRDPPTRSVPTSS